MPIYRCNSCGFVSDTTSTPTGSKANCERCNTPSTVFNSVYYIEKLAERYIAALRELEALKQPDTGAHNPATDTRANRPPAPMNHFLSGIDVHNTSVLANAQQHQPLNAWFVAHHIDASFDHSAVDTSGFFLRCGPADW